MYPLIRPLLFRLDPETAHEFALGWLRRQPPFARRAVRWWAGRPDPRLAQKLWDLDFRSPIGLAAGMDKNAVAVPAFAALGFSHVEVGTVTGQGQPGNAKPRLFRLVADQAVINRMGFNNEGAEAVAARLAALKRAGGAGCVLGVNLGKTKAVELDKALDDYQASVRALGPLADYVVVNVSSPNTPGLRDLQDESRLRPLLAGIRQALDAVSAGKPLLLKIAPDLADEGVDATVDVALETGCDGIICTNTTISRGGLSLGGSDLERMGSGGLSGRPLRPRSTQVLARVARRLRNAGRPLPVVGVGGVDSPQSAWEKITHGASLVQVYTGFIYQGPWLVKRIHRGLAKRLDELGLKSITEAVGRDL